MPPVLGSTSRNRRPIGLTMVDRRSRTRSSNAGRSSKAIISRLVASSASSAMRSTFGVAVIDRRRSTVCDATELVPPRRRFRLVLDANEVLDAAEADRVAEHQVRTELLRSVDEDAVGAAKIVDRDLAVLIDGEPSVQPRKAGVIHHHVGLPAAPDRLRLAVSRSMTAKVGVAAVGERRKPGMGKLSIYLSALFSQLR